MASLGDLLAVRLYGCCDDLFRGRVAAQPRDRPDRACDAKPPGAGEACNPAFHDAGIMPANPALADIYRGSIRCVGFVFFHDPISHSFEFQ